MKNRDSVIKRSEALEMVKSFVDGNESLTVSEYGADCKNFPCPDDLDSWSGETSAFYVEDEEGNEIYAVAYWDGCE